jgi:glycosyltransferase involved in cell wall biosynthesis
VKQYGSTPDLPGACRQYDFAKSLAVRNYSVSYFLSSFHYQLHRDAILSSRESFRVEKRDGINLVWIKSFPYYRNDWRRVFNIVNFAWCFYTLGRRISGLGLGIDHPDVILAFNLPLLTPLCAYYLSQKYCAPFYLEIGDLWPQTLIDMGKLKEKSLLTLFLSHIERFLYNRAEKIVTPLPFVPEYISSIGFPKKGVWIGSGVDFAKYQNHTSTPKEDDKYFTVMYFGAHGPANDLFNVLEALDRIQNQGYDKIRLVLVGDGVDKPALIQAAQRMKLNSVKFQNPIPKDEVPEMTKKADAFLFPLREVSVFKYGINPNKLADYLCAAKPIVFAAQVRNNVVKELGCGITAKPGDPEALAKAIIRLYRTPPKERTKMGLRGRKYAEIHLDAEKVADKLSKALGLN